MATSSTIAIKNVDGTVTGIYCHSDGYTSHNGRILQENYFTEAQVRELIELGDLSCLGETIGSKVDYDDFESHKGQCVAYGRDRYEQEANAMTYVNHAALIEGMGQEYDYLFTPSKGWSVRHFSGSHTEM